jgi:hypothetical protein
MDLSGQFAQPMHPLEHETRWERGADWHFRPKTKLIWRLWDVIDSDRLETYPGYRACTEYLHSHPLIGGHLNRLVGTAFSASRMDANGTLMSFIYSMVDEQGHLTFTDAKFDAKWSALIDLCRATHIPLKAIAPLPSLDLPAFPFALNQEVMLDRFTDDEVTRAFHVGVIRPLSERFALIPKELGVGIRRTMLVPKVVRGDDPPPAPSSETEGRFGYRPPLLEHLALDDVSSAMRLFKSTQIRHVGYLSWTDSSWLNSGTSFRILGHGPYGGRFELSGPEVQDLLVLWHLLEEEGNRLAFSIHRFNLAFDRGLLADRLVDLVIAAEALLLGDLDDKYRGELRFRFALRAAKFIAHPTYAQRDVFRVMRQAYDARSAIVHGGSPKDTRLPNDSSAKLPALTDAVEELVRLGLRKALAMKDEGAKLKQSNFWDGLVF